MKRVLTVFLLSSYLFCLGATGQKKPNTQTRPNLSGTWVMQDQSNTAKKVFPGLSDLTLVIDHREPEIRITRRFTLDNNKQEQELVYYSDGRGEENLTLRGGKTKSTTTTKWKGSVLVIRHGDYSASVSGPAIAGQREVEWQLSAGGTVLVERDTTTYHNNSASDASMSSRDRSTSAVIPSPVILERVYKKGP
jgi:hypothetical protein